MKGGNIIVTFTDCDEQHKGAGQVIIGWQCSHAKEGATLVD